MSETTNVAQPVPGETTTVQGGETLREKAERLPAYEDAQTGAPMLLRDEVLALFAGGDRREPEGGTDGETVRALHARLDAYESIFRWLLGEEGDFPARPERAEGKPYPYYYWRTPLRWKLEHARGSATPSRPESDQ